MEGIERCRFVSEFLHLWTVLPGRVDCLGVDIEGRFLIE